MQILLDGCCRLVIPYHAIQHATYRTSKSLMSSPGEMKSTTSRPTPFNWVDVGLLGSANHFRNQHIRSSIYFRAIPAYVYYTIYVEGMIAVVNYSLTFGTSLKLYL